MMVRGSITVLVDGSSKPTVASSARSAGAISSPPRIPITDATKPITSVSTTTELSTWRRDAPSVRSSANSRERWATVTANVLKIRKPPTNTAMPANTSSAIVRKPSESVMSADALSASSWPVRTSARAAQRARRSPALSCSGEVPSCAATAISVISPGVSAIRCTSSSGIDMLLMPSDSWSPSLEMPTTSYSFAGARPAIFSLSPTW